LSQRPAAGPTQQSQSPPNFFDRRHLQISLALRMVQQMGHLGQMCKIGRLCSPPPEQGAEPYGRSQPTDLDTLFNDSGGAVRSGFPLPIALNNPPVRLRAPRIP
jgi:hypothetical protein